MGIKLECISTVIYCNAGIDYSPISQHAIRFPDQGCLSYSSVSTYLKAAASAADSVCQEGGAAGGHQQHAHVFCVHHLPWGPGRCGNWNPRAAHINIVLAHSMGSSDLVSLNIVTLRWYIVAGVCSWQQAFGLYSRPDSSLCRCPWVLRVLYWRCLFGI